MSKSGMTVLVVDDTANNVAIASQVVKRMGHRFIEASSGEEALEKFLAESPDMILMDVMMPGIGGLEATRRIRQAAGSRWLPILVVTALAREDEVLEGRRAGADDYLTKPLSLPVFQAKIQVFQRIAELQQELSKRSAELSSYYRQAADERRLGARLMEYMVNREGLSDPALRYRVTPAWHFSGDLIAAARTPGTCHHILLTTRAAALVASARRRPIPTRRPMEPSTFRSAGQASFRRTRTPCCFRATGTATAFGCGT